MSSLRWRSSAHDAKDTRTFARPPATTVEHAQLTPPDQAGSSAAKRCTDEVGPATQSRVRIVGRTVFL
jgi:hypothetical protein